MGYIEALQFCNRPDMSTSRLLEDLELLCSGLQFHLFNFEGLITAMWGYGPAMGFLLSSACTLLHVSLHSKAISIGTADGSTVDPRGDIHPGIGNITFFGWFELHCFYA